MFTHVLLPRALRRDGINMLFAPSYVAPIRGAKNVVLTLHDISYEAHPEWTPPVDRLLLRAVSKYAAKYARRILTMSRFSKNEIMRLYGIPAERISVIPLAPDPTFGQMTSAAEEKQILEKFGVGPSVSPGASGSFLLFVGHIINRRHPIEIIRAFTAIAKDFPDLLLLFVGPDRTYPRLNVRGEVERAHTSLGRVAIQHSTSANDRELSVLYRKASALVWTSRYEGFGLPPIEALSLGTPVITSHAGSLPEVVGEAALRLGEPLDAGALADAIRRILRDDLLRVYLKKKAEEQAKKFSWEKTAKETLKVFKSVLEQKSM